MEKRKIKEHKNVIYFSDEKNDEFSSAVITAKKIDSSYRYERSGVFAALTRFFWYRVVAIPTAFFYLKLWHGHKIENTEEKKALKTLGKQGCFIYGNHTQATGDALIPTFINSLRATYVIVHPNNVSMKFLGRLTPYMGAIPLPDGLSAGRNFNAVIKKRIEQKKNIFIYPEAHIWPYYTGIRNFGDESFTYPVKYGTPVFCFTNTYQKRGISKRPRIVSYIDGPFYPDTSLPPRERRQKLRDEVHAAMLNRAELSTVDWVEYRPIEEKGD